MSRSAITERLVADGLLTAAQLEEAVAISAETSVPMLRVLVDRGFVDEVSLFMVAAEVAGMPFVDPGALVVDPAASGTLDGARARKMRALPFSGSSYEWADLDGTTTRIVIGVIDAAVRLGDWALVNSRPDLASVALTAGMRVMPGHPDLVRLEREMLAAARG